MMLPKTKPRIQSSLKKEEKPKFEDFLHSVKKTLMLRTYGHKNKNYVKKMKPLYDVKSVRYQKRKLRKIDMEPKDY
jgi:hypothetical protein